MVRYIYMIVFLTMLSVFFLGAEANAQKVMTVQVKKTQLRATPSHLGKIITRASYGARVTILEERGDWKRVSYGNSRGWLHATAVTTKKIALKAGQTGKAGSVSQDEIALAGKGFSEEVEARYRKTNRSLDYTWINRMEAFAVSAEQMETFINEGRLKLNTEGG
jgi:uncharacterized protein YraI